jgi:mono/diheme cytochrome c family protein
MNRSTLAAGVLLASSTAVALRGLGQQTDSTRTRLDPPRLYEQACAACHGADGKGSLTWEGEDPVPDLSDCLGNTAEPAEHWETVVRLGGPSRGLSPSMPAYGEALDPEEIRGLVAHLRTFCRGWERYPPGDLNFRRPLETGKAYPEQEVVLKPEFARGSGESASGIELTYENRLGRAFQYEVTLPVLFDSVETPSEAGIGDIELEAKQVLSFSLERAQILSAGLGLLLPTGSRERGLGDGAMVFEPFVAYGQAWDRTFVQARAAFEISANTDRRDSELALQLALSRALGPPRVAWVPAIELLASVNLATGQDEWSTILEVSKALNPLGHVIAAAGLRLPLTEGREDYRVVAYLLWDFGDGPFWFGW